MVGDVTSAGSGGGLRVVGGVVPNKDWSDFQRRFRPRVTINREAETLSEKLGELGLPQHVSQRWMAHEIKKLVPEAEKLEKRAQDWAVAGLFIGAAVTALLIVVGMEML